MHRKLHLERVTLPMNPVTAELALLQEISLLADVNQLVGLALRVQRHALNVHLHLISETNSPSTVLLGTASLSSYPSYDAHYVLVNPA